MILTVVLIALDAAFWGGWGLSFARDGVADPVQTGWYIYGPLAVALGTTTVPIVALATGHFRSGARRAWLRLALILSLLAFFPYACVSGGGV